MLTLVMPLEQTPACTEHVSLVDAAFEHKAGPEANELRTRICPTCPVRLQCLVLGNRNGEHGIWGGLSTNERVRAGGRPSRHRSGTPYNLAGLHPRKKSA